MSQSKVKITGAVTDNDLATSQPIEKQEESNANEEALKAVASNTNKINFKDEVAKRVVDAAADSPAEVKPAVQNVKGGDLKQGDRIILGPNIIGKVFEAPTKNVRGSVRTNNDGRFWSLFYVNTYRKIVTENPID